jgi:hypothetical protein
VFADDPALAVDWLNRAAEDPGSVVYSGTWYETEAGQEWLNAALAAAGSPEQQAEILLEFVAVYQATQPEPVGPLTILHDLLDIVSWVDPTQLADALNAGVYALEGDELNAAISAGGILLPLAGGGAIRMTRDGLLALAARNGDEALEAAMKQAIRRGDLTPEKLDEIVGGVRKQFGDATADSLRRYFDDLRRAPGVGTERPEQLIDELASAGVRHNPDEIVRIARDDSGRVVFLEEGNPSSGLAHIADAHGAQFAQQGIPEGQLPDLLISAVTDGRRVGMQGTRPIFEVEFGGRTVRVAVSVSENGYIVGANPRSMP